MRGIKEKKWICLFCRYSTRTKLIICPECDRKKFAFRIGDQFFCKTCEYPSGELFRTCPQCGGNKRSVEKRKSVVFSSPGDEVVKSNGKPEKTKPLVYIPGSMNYSQEATDSIKNCADCYEENLLFNDKCWACGGFEFIDLSGIREHRSEGQAELKEGIKALVLIPFIGGFLYFVAGPDFLNTDMGYLFISSLVLLTIAALSLIAESYYRFHFGERQPVLRIISWCSGAIAIGVFLILDIITEIGSA